LCFWVECRKLATALRQRQQSPINSMSISKIFRAAPSRLDRRAASIWRFWHQGDEFYAAARDSTHAAKISFHRNGNWQARVGPASQRFTSSRLITPDWLHALSVHWILLPDAFLPKSSGHENCTLVEVPNDCNLILNLVVSTTGSALAQPRVPPVQSFVWYQRLRSGRILAIDLLTELQTDHDREIASWLRREGTFTVDKLPGPDAFYAELAWLATRAEGNTVVIVPVGPDSLRLKQGASDAA
jgi:hypothetical protein